MFASVVAILASVLPATSATLTWDADGVSPVNGGSGFWNTSATTWTPDGGGSYSMWSNAVPDSAVFTGAAGTVTLGEAIVAASISINANSYTIDLAGFDLLVSGTTGGTAPNLSSTTITNTSGTIATLTTGTLSGGGPRMTGNMNVTYNGGAWNSSIGTHDFTGTLSLLGTGLIRSDGVPLGSATGLVRLGGTHTLQLGTAAGQFRTFTRNIELLNSTTSINPGGLRTLTLSGNISGPGEFKQSSTQGAVVLAGNNTYTGSTYIIGAGITLIAGSNAAFGDSALIDARTGSGGSGTASTVGFQGNINVSGTTTTGTRTISFPGSNPASGLGALHNFSGDNSYAGNVTNGSNVARVYGAEPGSTLTLSGVVGGGKGLVKIGGGTIVLTGQNVYGTANAITENGTVVNSGILRLDFSLAAAGHDIDIVNFGNSTNGTMATGLLLGGGTLELKGRDGATNSQRFKNNNTAGSGFTINAGASTVRAIQNGAASLSMNLGQVAARNVGGTVDFTLPGVGAFTLPQGTLPTGTFNEIIRANGAAFATVGLSDWAARDASNTIVNGAEIGGFYTANTATDLAGNADMSAASLTTLGSSPVLTSLRFGSPGARIIDATGQTLTTGGILVTTAVGNNPSTIAGGTLQGATGAATQDLVVFQYNPANTLTIGSIIADNVSATGLTKSGQGGLILTAANTYTGVTTVNAGVLRLNQPAAVPGGIDATIGAGESALTFNGGVLGLASNNDFTRALGTGAGQVRFVGSGGFAAYGGDRIVNIGGATAAVSWNTGNFIPTMSNLILSAPDADGTLIFQNPINTLPSAASPISRTIQVENGLAVVDARLTGVVAEGGGFIKTGGGTLEMSASNTYTGSTSVDAGTLLVTGSLTAATAVSVNNSGTLAVGGATGKVNGPVTVNPGGTVTGNSTPPLAGTSLATVTLNGGTIAPGTTVGSLSSGSVFFNTGIFSLEVASDVSFDQLDVTGTVTFNAPMTLTLSLSSTLPNGALLTILRNDASEPINFTSGAARFVYNSDPLDEGDIFNVTGGFGSQQLQIFYTGDTGNDVVLVAVPEPGTAAAWLAGVGALLGLRPSRRRAGANG